ncbi:hypothetical protein [Paenibacillus aestuarii]|uniref:Uncharacterized protein n=1 Tax=Paenibacillus aestuarii TaxID=516965 RepID=A0ABW0KBP0_9BACL|nr:hypothetical protein [Paenibacillus aestuarii]
MEEGHIRQIIGILGADELLEPETYGFAINGHKLLKQAWRDHQDTNNLFIGPVLARKTRQIVSMVREAEGQIVAAQEGYLEKIIDNYKVLFFYPPVSQPLTLEFYRLGSEGFPWPEIKACFDHKWPFVLTEKKLCYLHQEYELREGDSDFDTIVDVWNAIHRNKLRLEIVDGIYEGQGCLVNSYTLTNGDNVLVFMPQGSLEIRYMPS